MSNIDTNALFQIIGMQQAAQEGYAVGLLWATMVGAVVGLIPLVFGVLKQRIGLGFLGFALCIVAGFFGSVFFAGPVAAGMMIWISVWSARAAQPTVSWTPTTSSVSGAPSAPRPPTTLTALPWPAGHHEHLAEGRIRFSGLGVLLQAHSGGWQFLGKLPLEAELPADGSPATYKLRLLSGEEFIESFSRAQQPDVPVVRPEAPPAPASVAHVIDRLEALNTLKQSGGLTETEFADLKGRLLAEARSA